MPFIYHKKQKVFYIINMLFFYSYLQQITLSTITTREKYGANHPLNRSHVIFYIT